MAFFDWRYLFDEIFQDYPDDWKLNYVHRNELNRIQGLQSHRKMNREKPASFFCKRCPNRWLSAKAQVIFYYPNKNRPLGKVTMQILGQQCRKCAKKSGPYADPIFDVDTMANILEKLYERIGCDCYHKPRPHKKKNNVDDENDGLYDKKGEHETRLCEACKLGVFTYSRNVHQ